MGQAGLRWMRLLAGLAVAACVVAPAAARQRMTFTPGKHGNETFASFSRHPRVATGLGRPGTPAARRNGQRMIAGEEPDMAPTPGAGFKMEDGVLTYPAPARFQPKNLKHL